MTGGLRGQQTVCKKNIITGRCCGVLGDSLNCADGVTFDECTALGGVFAAGESCSGSDACADDCPAFGRCCRAIPGVDNCMDTLCEVNCSSGTWVAGEVCLDEDANGDGFDDACREVGRCCGAVDAPLGCASPVSQQECQGLGEPTLFESGESCSGVDQENDGVDDVCPALPVVPAVSSWGILILGLLLASLAKLYGLRGTPERRPHPVIEM